MLFVRHAMPIVDPAVPSSQWRLGPDGRAAARLLTAYVPDGAVFVSSPETKAVETLREIAGASSVRLDSGFAEARRPWGGDSYRARAEAYVRGVDQPGWEPQDAVVSRFDAAVRRYEADGLVVGTHGLALTLWLASRSLAVPDPASFWAALRFPDVVRA